MLNIKTIENKPKCIRLNATSSDMYNNGGSPLFRSSYAILSQLVPLAADSSTFGVTFGRH